MTKKIICAFIASIPSLVLASWNEGYYLSTTGGYSTAKAQLKDSTSVQLFGAKLWHARGAQPIQR
ncbi:MAG: hypothetical protein C0582_04440 [Alphaproteobacteria bacterium]|nr:MAG: hypothetical protein C0582_04440 [Alphaproteobacteria bacterium]